MTSKKLFVEGRDDQWVVANVAVRHGFSLDKRNREFEIVPKESVDQVISAIREAIEPEYELDRLGVIVDRDSHEENHWGRITAALVRHYHIPAGLPVSQGCILHPHDPGRPIVGVWLMPDNVTEGMLEDFVLSMVPAEDGLIAHAREVVVNVPAVGSRFQTIHQAKALAHTWLAWQREPGLPFGTAIEGGFLDVQTPLAVDFADWLRVLFR